MENKLTYDEIVAQMKTHMGYSEEGKNCGNCKFIHSANNFCNLNIAFPISVNKNGCCMWWAEIDIAELAVDYVESLKEKSIVEVDNSNQEGKFPPLKDEAITNRPAKSTATNVSKIDVILPAGETPGLIKT